MTEILYNWINKEVKLSKEITNICEDFSNGYFFGELLYKYKLLPQFNEFKNSQEKSSITKNYLLLKYKLDELKINFSEKDKNDIINKKKYKAEMILFRIREKLLSKLLQIEFIEQGNKTQKDTNFFYEYLLPVEITLPTVSSISNLLTSNINVFMSENFVSEVEYPIKIPFLQCIFLILLLT